MQNALLFDFLPDRSANTLTIRREFAAPRQLVWDCYTKSELLNQWFAPAPLSTITKSMDFRPGGHWHYAMIDPQGKEYWGYTEYLTVHPIDNFSSRDAFSNAAGEIDKELPRADWQVGFSDKGAHTVVESIVRYHSLSDLEKVIQMGMEQGMKSTLEKLDTFLPTVERKVTVTALVQGAGAKVWEYYTKPEHITQWNFADPSWHCPFASNDLRPGGKYSARMEARDGSFGFDLETIYNEVVEGVKLNSGMPNGRYVTVSFNPKGDETEVAVTFDPEDENPIEMQRMGWQAILNNFKKYMEEN